MCKNDIEILVVADLLLNSEALPRFFLSLFLTDFSIFVKLLRYNVAGLHLLLQSGWLYFLLNYRCN